MFPDVRFLSMSLYEWCFLLGVVAALVVARIYADKLGMSARLFNSGILCAVAAILFGYGSAVLFQAVYDFTETGVFRLNAETGATFLGGLAGGAAVFILLWFTLVRKICGKEAIERFREVLGIGACSVAIAHAIGRIGCLMAGCCHGAVTDSWIGMWQPGADHGRGARVIPTQLLESIFLFELFFFLTYALFRSKVNGIAVYMTAYGFFRFVIEFVRADDRGASFIGFLSPSQVWSVLLFVAGAALLLYGFLRQKRRN